MNGIGADMRLGSISSLGYVGLGVQDPAAWQVFAEKFLGLEARSGEVGSEVACHLRMDEHHHRFLLHEDPADDLAYVGWEVPDEESLDASAASLEQAGVAARRATDEELEIRRVAGMINLQDPSGLELELFYGPLITNDAPFSPGRAVQGFVTGEQGMGHIVVVVDDFEQTLAFYRDLLGMRLSDFVRMDIAPDLRGNVAFLRCNSRHHSLAFLAAPGPEKRLNHFMLQLREFDDVGLVYDHCQESGLKIAGTLGRHTNDEMVSFYVETPSGFLVEYGWGARTIDEGAWQVEVHRQGSIWGHQGIYPSLPS